MKPCSLFLYSLVLSLAPAVLAQGGTNVPGKLVVHDQSTARQIVLDVVVTDGKGHPIDGLKEADFRLFEKEVPQTLTRIVEQDATLHPSNLNQPPPLPPNTFQVHPPSIGNGAVAVILLSYLEPKDGREVRGQLSAYLNSTGQLRMPVAVLSETVKGIHLVQELTTDKQALLEAISSERLLPSTSRKSSDVNGKLKLVTYLTAIPGRVNLIRFSVGTGGLPVLSKDVLLRDLNAQTTTLVLNRIALYTINTHYIEAPDLNDSMMSGVIYGDPNSVALGTNMGGKTFHDNDRHEEDLAEVMNTGGHFYTLYYTSTDSTWDGAHRDIRLELARSAESGRQSSRKSQDPRLEYQHGYFARPGSQAANSSLGSGDADLKSERFQRRLLTEPPLGSRSRTLKTPIMNAAMRFGLPTPTQLPFKVTITLSDKTTVADSGGFLNPHYRGQPYRNYQIHYSIDPKDLSFDKDSDSFSDSLRFVAVLYTDDGFEANSIATPGRIAGKAEEFDKLLTAPFSFDQVIAVPISGVFYLRVGIHEFGSDHIGAIEIPLDALKH